MRKTLLPLLLVALPILAQPVYSYKDSNGNTVFTGQQPPANVDAEQVKLPGIQTIMVEEKPTPNQQRPNFKTNKQPTISNVSLVGIPNEESLRANNGTFTVSVNLQTESNDLPANYQYQLLLDDSPYGPIQSSNNFTLTNIDRGTHTIQAHVINNGAIIASSSVETFTLQRVSTTKWKIQPR